MTERKKKNWYKDAQQQTMEQINAQYGKLPPQAIEVEEAVLGAIMLERDAIYKVLPILQAESFYKEEHRKIFETVQQMASANRTIDLLQVTQTLRDQQRLDEIGGPGYITKLTRRVASAAHIEHHARILSQKFILREIIRRCTELTTQAYSDDYDETEAMYNMQTMAIDDLMVGSTGMLHISQIASKSVIEIKDRIEKVKQGISPGITSGSTDFDAINGGHQPGELIVIGARPSMGKTAYVLNSTTKKAALAGNDICFFSLEMEDTKLFNRLACSYGGIIRENLTNGRMTEGDWTAFNRAAAELKQLPIYIDDTAATNTRYIEAVIRNKVRRGECKMAVVDYLQLIESTDFASNKNREREVAETCRSLKKIAKSTGIPIILLVQLNREIEKREDKKPRISDIRESGAIEQDADVIALWWRPCYYDENATTEDGTPLTGVGLLEIVKYREGYTCSIPLKHNHDLTQFFDYNTRQFSEPAFWEETDKE